MFTNPRQAYIYCRSIKIHRFYGKRIVRLTSRVKINSSKNTPIEKEAGGKFLKPAFPFMA